MVRKIIEKFNDLKIEKFAPETAELEIGPEVSGWKFENLKIWKFGNGWKIRCSSENLEFLF